MRTLELGPPAPVSGLRRQSARPGTSRVIRGDALLLSQGEPVAVQIVTRGRFDGLAARLLVCGSFGNNGRESRLSGFGNTHAIFGNVPPNPLRKRFGASAAAMSWREPALQRALSSLAPELHSEIMAYAPARVRERHEEIMAEVPAVWRLGASPYTSGIVNHTAALPYHLDSGNFKGGWSVMIGMRRAVSGGHLHLPEFGVSLSVEDGSLLGFDGAGTWHGVTPFKRLRPDGFRFTAVYYAKAAMARCAPTFAEELAKAQLTRTESEERIAREWMPRGERP